MAGVETGDLESPRWRCCSKVGWNGRAAGKGKAWPPKRSSLILRSRLFAPSGVAGQFQSVLQSSFARHSILVGQHNIRMVWVFRMGCRHHTSFASFSIRDDDDGPSIERSLDFVGGALASHAFRVLKGLGA